MTMTHLIAEGIRPLFLAFGAALIAYLAGTSNTAVQRVVLGVLATVVALLSVVFAVGYGIDLKEAAGCR